MLETHVCGYQAGHVERTKAGVIMCPLASHRQDKVRRYVQGTELSAVGCICEGQARDDAYWQVGGTALHRQDRLKQPTPAVHLSIPPLHRHR